MKPARCATPRGVVRNAKEQMFVDARVRIGDLVIKLNGNTTSDVVEDDLKVVSGPIQLQAAGPDGPGAAKFQKCQNSDMVGRDLNGRNVGCTVGSLASRV